MVRHTLELTLGELGEVEVRGAADVAEALKLSAEAGPFDLAVVDLNMPGMDGLDGLRRLIEANSGAPVALISGDISRETAARAFSLGAAGVIHKTMKLAALVHAFRMMLAGERFVPAALFADPPASAAEAGEVGKSAGDGSELTRREQEILRLLRRGLQNKEIARQLGVGPVTVAMHLTTIYRKLGVTSRLQAATKADGFGDAAED